MNKVKIKITLLALITGMFLVVVSGCGYRCQSWAYRTGYRQVCKSYSSNGHCSFWGSESYQERYCTRWIKDPAPKKIPGSKRPSSKFIRKAGESHFPKNVNSPTEGENFLLSQLTPFLCEIMKSDDINKTLASMGEYTAYKYWYKCTQIVSKEPIYQPSCIHPYCMGEFITKSLAGGFSLRPYKYNINKFWVKPAHKNSWPFTKDELADWLSNLGLVVWRDSYGHIAGGADFSGYSKNRFGTVYYEFSIEEYPRMKCDRNKYDSAPFDSPKDIIQIRWKHEYKPKASTLFCKEGYQKQKSLPQKEQKQKRGTIKNQFEIATHRGLAWYRKGNYDRAISDYDKAIELNPRYAIAYYNRGLAWYRKGNYDRAISDYNKAIELNPRLAQGYNNRGVTWKRKGNYDRAISDYNKAIELNPKYANAYNNRGYVWYRKSNYNRAISDYNKAIELNPKYADAYNNRGNAWYTKHNYDRAIPDHNKAIELNPRYADAYNSRGNAWYYKGNYDRSCHDYQKACKLGQCIGLNWARKKGYCK